MKPMRESVLIVPKRDNDGGDLAAVQSQAAESLIDAFGGVTVQEATGGWKAPDGTVILEPVWRLISAYEPKPENDKKIKAIAEAIGKAAHQIAVYIRYAGGNVEIVNTT